MTTTSVINLILDSPISTVLWDIFFLHMIRDSHALRCFGNSHSTTAHGTRFRVETKSHSPLRVQGLHTGDMGLRSSSVSSQGRFAT